MEDQVLHKPEAVWLLEDDNMGTQIKEEPKAELARDGEIELASWESLEMETLQLPPLKEEQESHTVSDSEGASFDVKPVKKEFCEGEAKEDELEEGRANTPDREQDGCCKLEIVDNNILEDGSRCRLSPGFGGLRVRREVAGSSVEAADNSEPDIEIPVQKESYKCRICNMSFSQASHLVLHTRKSHPGAKSFTCQHCTKCFTHRSNLKNHIRTHTGEKPFSCEHCDKCFSHASVLIAHKRTHTGEKPFSCEYCNKCFRQKSIQIAHIRTHTGEKPFSCEHCNKCFGRSSALIGHIRTHTGEKPFSCEHCNEGFSHRNRLIEHLRTHTGEKPLSCEFCSKPFAQKSALVAHRRLHTGEKPFSCEFCNKCFRQRSAFNNHVKTHRGE